MDKFKCPYCRNEIEIKTEFCPNCGWFLAQDLPRETLHDAREIEEARIFLSLSSHEKFRIEKAYTTLGREMGDILFRDDLELSRLHCEFIYKDHNLYVKDLDSHNGVFIGERRIPPGEEIPVQHGDRVKIGSNVFTVEFRSDTGTGDEMGPIYYLKASGDGKEYQLRLGENLVGRGEYCHVRIEDAPYVAHEHAVIELVEEQMTLGKITTTIQDKGSKNGTMLNGVQLAPFKNREIEDGDEILFADKSFKLISKPRQ